MGELVGGITKPAGVDIARDDEGLRPSPFVVSFRLLLIRLGGVTVGMPADGGVKGVGEGVLEDASEVFVDHAGGDVVDDFFDGGGGEGPAVGDGALVGEFQRTITEWWATEEDGQID